jgi:hypothetical protein
MGAEIEMGTPLARKPLGFQVVAQRVLPAPVGPIKNRASGFFFMDGFSAARWVPQGMRTKTPCLAQF